LCDPHRAAVIGINRQFSLRGISMTSPDIRAGVALLIAAMSAEGSSTINNINQIDRDIKKLMNASMPWEQKLSGFETYSRALPLLRLIPSSIET
jgi:hypothetical protein